MNFVQFFDKKLNVDLIKKLAVSEGHDEIVDLNQLDLNRSVPFELTTAVFIKYDNRYIRLVGAEPDNNTIRIITKHTLKKCIIQDRQQVQDYRQTPAPYANQEARHFDRSRYPQTARDNWRNS